MKSDKTQAFFKQESQLMKRKIILIFICIFCLTSLCLLYACGKNAEKPKVKVLIIPKFEIGEMSGDEAGEL